MKRVTATTAQLAKDKGFIGPTFFIWDIIKKEEVSVGQKRFKSFGGWDSVKVYREDNYPYLLLPMQSTLQQWIAKEYDLHIEIYPVRRNKLSGSVTMYNWRMKKLNKNQRYQTRKSGEQGSYERALEEALTDTLNYLK